MTLAARDDKNLITIEHGDGSLRTQFVISEQLATAFIDFIRDMQEEGEAVHEVVTVKGLVQ